MERKCYLCGDRLSGCFGYVIARDFVDYISGKREDIRELCGKDFLRIELISKRNKVDICELIESIL